MINTLQDIGKRFTDLVYITQGELTVAQLTVFKLSSDQAFDELVNAFRCRISEHVFHVSA